jgi:hypothetical protein
MKRCSLTPIVLLLLLASYITVIAQRKSGELTNVEDKLISSFEEKFPTWIRKEVSPIKGSGDVIINQWTLDHNLVGVTIIRYSSEEESHERMRQFVNDMKAEKNVADEADEEYSLGSGKNSVTLRKGRFIVNVQVNAAEANDEKQLLKRFTGLALRAVKQ